MKFSTLFRKKAKDHGVEHKSALLDVPPNLASLLTFGSHDAASPAAAFALYSDSTAVSIPVNLVAEGFASLVPVLEVNGRVETDHPVLELLRRPNNFMTGTMFLEALGKHYLITGEAGVGAAGTVTRPPVELWAIAPPRVTVQEGAAGLPASYLITTGVLSGAYHMQSDRGGVRYYDGTLRQFHHIRSFSTKDDSLLRGQSPLLSASREVRQHILGNRHNVSLLEKGGRVSLVFHFDQEMDDDEFQETKARVRAQYGGAQNAGEIGVTAGGKLSIQEAGVNNKDMDFANLQRMARDAVALQYKVPLPLMSTEASTFNNYREAKLALYDDAVLPLADRLFDALSDMLLPRYGMDPKQARITYSLDSITALTMRRNEELQLRKTLAIETTNELRTMLGRDPVAGGDDVMIPAGLIPLGSDLFTGGEEPQVMDLPPTNPTEAEEEETEGEAAEDEDVIPEGDEA